MRRSPLFASVAILSLALGIGANTAIFTLMDQLMLRDLPVKDPQSLVMLYQEGANNGSNIGDRMHSYPLYRDLQQKAAPFSEVLCRRLAEISVKIDNQSERVDAELVSGNYFQMLGVKAALGRVLNSREDDQIYQGHPVVVISHDYWQSRFAGDPKVLGKRILVNNYPMTVVGVSAANFRGIDPVNAPQLRIPVLMQPVVTPEWTFLKMDDRRTRWVQIFARLKPGYTVESAAAPLGVLYAQIRRYEMTLPETAKWTPYLKDQFLRGTVHMDKASTGYSQLRNNVSTALIVLMAMVGLVLLIACGNVANLLIARAFARQKEIAVRLSIGASRGELVRQLLTESLVLAALGGAAGIVIAVGLTRALLKLVPVDENNPLQIHAWPDLRILAFTAALALGTGLVFGLLPALRASRPDLWTTLKDAMGSIAGRGGSLFLRKGLVAAQVALSFLLLFGAGLFVKSLQNLRLKNTGFSDLDNLVTFQVSPAMSGYDDPHAEQFYARLMDNVRATPGIKSAGYASVAVLADNEWDSSMSVEGHTARDGEDMQAFMNSLSPGYFKAMGTPLLEGRDFDGRDAKKKSEVAIVNESFARHFFGNESALGRHIGFGGGPDTKLDITIVGVAGDALYEGPRKGVRRQAYIPHFGNRGVAIYARTSIGSSASYAALRGAVRKTDASIPVFEMKTLAARLDQTLASERLIAMLSAGFGMLATLLASIGLYGVMAFAVARRTRELGVRMALGAKPGSVVWLVMKEVLTLAAIGLAVGIPAALGLGRFVASQLFELEANDPWVAAISLVVLVSVASIAGLIPARRASRIDPIVALRYE